MCFLGYQYNWSTGRGLTYFRSKKRSIMISNSWNMDMKLVRSGLFFRNGWTFKNLNEIRTEFNCFPAVGKTATVLVMVPIKCMIASSENLPLEPTPHS